MNFVYFLLILGAGFFLIKYNKWLRDSTGLRFEFFERNVGPGATLDVLKIFGILVIAFSFWALFNL
jgi:hypothetical protein